MCSTFSAVNDDDDELVANDIRSTMMSVSRTVEVVQKTHSDSKTFPDLSRRSDLVPSSAQPNDDDEYDDDEEDYKQRFNRLPTTRTTTRRLQGSQRWNRTRVNPTVPFSVNWPVRIHPSRRLSSSTVSTTSESHLSTVMEGAMSLTPHVRFLFYFLDSPLQHATTPLFPPFAGRIKSP